MSVPTPRPPLVLAISGCSSSGKSTLTYLLTSLLSPTFTIQQDDFNRGIPDLPLLPSGIPDADSVASTDIPRFIDAVHYAQQTGGAMPEDFVSWQDPAATAEARRTALARVSSSARDAARKRMQHALRGRGVGIVEGFLLYQDEQIRRLAEIKLFLRTSKVAAKARRMRRPGYGDPETKDFWRTEAYFEECVWGNYVKESGWMFQDGDVEGPPIEGVEEAEGIRMQPGLDMGVEETFEWAVEEVCAGLEHLS